MDRINTFTKYILMAIGLYLFTSFVVFVGLNLNYKTINCNNQQPEYISIEKAEATSKSGRIYGYVTNFEENNLNGKYIKIEVYNSNNEKDEVQYLKVDDLKDNEKKMFKAFFKTDNATYCNIDIVENEND